MHQVRNVVRVEIRNDRVLTIAFQDWLLQQKDMFSIRGGETGPDSYVGYFDEVHDMRIDRFFAETKGRKVCPSCESNLVRKQACTTCWGAGRVVCPSQPSSLGQEKSK